MVHYIVMKGRSLEEDSPLGRQGEGFQETEWESVRAGQDVVRLRVKADFFKMKDEADFFYHHGNGWKQIGVTQKLHFGLGDLFQKKLDYLEKVKEFISGKYGKDTVTLSIQESYRNMVEIIDNHIGDIGGRGFFTAPFS